MRSPDIGRHIALLERRHPPLIAIRGEIERAYRLMEQSFETGGKLLIAGNGGSAADADHIVGELMKGFRRSRPVDLQLSEKLVAADETRGKVLSAKLQGCLPAIALHNHAALQTAFLNDVDGVLCFAQQVNGYARGGDVFLGISTSGNSENILHAAVTAKARGISVIGLTGAGGGTLSEIADVAVRAPEKETYLIQELHLPIYHCWCLMLEERFFGR